MANTIQMRFNMPDLMKDLHEEEEQIEEEIKELEPYFASKLNLKLDKGLNSPIEIGTIWK